MKKIILMMVFLSPIFLNHVFSQVVNELPYEWDMIHSGNNSNYQDSYIDVNGETYLLGYWDNTTEFNPLGVGAPIANSSGSPSIYLAKYDSDGVLLWFRQITKMGGAAGFFNDMYLTVSGSKVYVMINYAFGVGNANGVSINFWPSTIITGNASNKLCATLTSYDKTSGVHINTDSWFTNGADFSIRNGVCDVFDNIWIVGRYSIGASQSIDFNPSAGTDISSTVTTGMYVMKKLDVGNYQFTNKYAGLDLANTQSFGISPRANGGMLVFSTFTNTNYDVDLSAAVNNVSAINTTNGSLLGLSLSAAGGFVQSTVLNAPVGFYVRFISRKGPDDRHYLYYKYLNGCVLGSQTINPLGGSTGHVVIIFNDIGTYANHINLGLNSVSSVNLSFNDDKLYVNTNCVTSPNSYPSGTTILRYNIVSLTLEQQITSLAGNFGTGVNDRGCSMSVVGSTVKKVYFAANFGNSTQVGFPNYPHISTSSGGGNHAGIVRYQMCYQQNDTTSVNMGFCEFDTVSIGNASISAGSNWEWIHPDGSMSFNDTVLINGISGNDFGTYSLRTSDTNCVWRVYSFNVFQNSNPIISLPVTADDSTLCLGDDLVLNSQPNLNWSYSWTGPNGFVSNAQNPVILDVTNNNSGQYNLVVTDNTTGCSSVLNGNSVVNVIVNNLPLISTISVSDSTPCAFNDTLGLFANYGLNWTYEWSGPVNDVFGNPILSSTLQNPTFSNYGNFADGFWHITVTDTTTGCSSITDSIYIDVLGNPSGVGGDGTIDAYTDNGLLKQCENDTGWVFVDIDDPDSLNFVYYWTGPNGFTSNSQDLLFNPYLPVNGGSYSLIVTDTVTGCYSTSGITLVIADAPSFNNDPLVSDLSPCFGDDIVFNAPGDPLPFGQQDLSYTWSGPNGFGGTDSSQYLNNFQVGNNGVYNLVIFDSITFCSAFLDVTVIGVPTPILDLGIDSVVVCNQSSYTIVPAVSSEYYWGDGSTSSTYIADTSGWVSLYVVSATCYSNPDSVYVDLSNAFEEISIISTSDYCLGDFVEFEAFGGGTYTWTGPNGFYSTSAYNSILSLGVSDLGIYNLFVNYQNGCALESSLLISIDESICSKIPEIVTNNNDGLNDNWTIDFLIAHPNNKVMIFNRWGTQIYELSPYHDEFNGVPNMGIGIKENNDEKLPNATYYYIIDVDGDGSNVLKGYFELQNN